MQYNTVREHLIIPEYGRNVQDMIAFACSRPEKAERNLIAKTIIRVMNLMQQKNKDFGELEQKLWMHLLIISDYKLDVDFPFEMPTKIEGEIKPDRLKYPSNKIVYKHYGQTIERLIQKAIEMDDSEEKKYLTKSLANLMKRTYLSWNKDSVTDEMIFAHLKELSGGKLALPEGETLQQTGDILVKFKKKRRPTAKPYQNKPKKRY